MQEKYIDETKQGEAFAIAEKPENSKKLFLESYGCQMNFSDSEIVASILNEQGYNTTLNQEEADLILLNTCSIREKAEQQFVCVCLSSKILKKKNQILPLVFLAVWLNVLKPNSWKRNNWLIWLLVRMLTEIFQISLKKPKTAETPSTLFSQKKKLMLTSIRFV